MPKRLVACLLVLTASTSAATARPRVDEEDGFRPSPGGVNICGQLSVCGAAEYLTGSDFTEVVFKALPANGGLHSLDDLRQMIRRIGLQTAAIRWPKGRLPSLQAPAIVRLEDQRNRGHFIVLLHSAGNYVQVLDLPSQPSWIHIEKLWERWDGVALHIASTSGQLPAPGRGALSLAVSLTSCCLGLLVLWILGARNVGGGALLPRGKLLWAGGTASVAASVLSFGLMATAVDVEPGRGHGQEPLRIEPSSGRIEVAADQQDDRNYSVVTNFRIISHGKKRLHIEEVASSCSCGSPSLNTSVLEPEGEAILSVKVYPARSRSKSFSLYLVVKGGSSNMFEIPCSIVPRR